jgi:glycosyltransferase involved in cell wall biosynthesis
LAKRGLLVSYYFPPTGGGGVQRWVKYLKYLSGLGWEFCVIANDHSPDSPKDETLLNELPQNIKIIRTQSSGTVDTIRSKFPFLKQSGYWQRWISAVFRITDSRLAWNSIAGKYLKDELANNDYDVVIVTSPPYSLAFLASAINENLNCPVVLDLRDPWTINPYKIYPTRIHRILDEHREKKTISKIDYLISAYQSTTDNYKNNIHNFNSKEVLILPNGYDEEDFKNIAAIESFKGGSYNIGFSGTIYSHLNTPDPVFEAMSKLIKKGMDIHFHHVGTSVYDLSELAKKYNIQKNIHVWGYTDHKSSLQLLQMMDALCLILDDRWPQSENTIGGKFYEYLRLKKPIFAVVPEKGEAAKVINKTNSGIIVSAKDSEIIAQNLKSLFINKQEFTWDSLEEYNREHQAEELNEYLEKIIG